MQEDVYQGDGLNLYAYCSNNPVVYYDPSGYKKGSNSGCPPASNNGGDGGAPEENESGRNSIDTPINSGVSKPRDVATPNSIYEQMNPDGTVKSRAFYDENGNQFSRQDFDHRHFDKKTKQYYQPHEHNYSYNENGQPTGKSDGPLPKGYSNKPTN